MRSQFQAMLADRLAEVPYRLRRRACPKVLTWLLTRTERERVVITWPSVYQWPMAKGIVETLKDALGRLCQIRIAATPQPYPGVVMLSCAVDGKARPVALDYSDYCPTNADALAASTLYIKLEYHRDGYEDERVIAGGYPVTGLDYYKYYLPYRSRYASHRVIDVLGRFGYRFQPELRKKAVALLSASSDINFVGSAGKVRYSRFLREAASARLCLDLPGNGSFTHRVAEFLGIGSCMISVRHATALHVPIEAGSHYVEISSDLSDLVDKCRYYIHNDEERERIASAGRDYFDRYLHCDQLASYYVRTILDRLA
jgi:hypothetical protein